MIDWIRKFVSSDTASQTPDNAEPPLLQELRRALRRIETIYMEGAWECCQLCPNELSDGPDEFSELMMDLHRGLIVKVLAEIARADRRWSRAERAAAVVMVRHSWGTTIQPDGIRDALRKTVELADSLEWESLLAPFCRYTPLLAQQSSLLSQVMRLANLIAKADGTVCESEVQALTRIQQRMEIIFAGYRGPAAASDQKTTRHNSRRPDASRPPDRRSGNSRQVGQQVADVSNSSMTSRDDSATSRQPVKPVLATKMPRLKLTSDPPSEEQCLNDALRELDDLVGLSTVKKDLQQLIAFLKIQSERVRLGLPETPVSLHTVFAGNPGTGKTTVARILGKALGAIGVLEKGHVIETDRSGLIARFAGQTGPLVNEKVDAALDGVLFIDEAYNLVSASGEDQFGEEAVGTLLKRMEDDRRRLIVILAGYPEPMQTMLKSNPGMSSRFQRFVTFPDYSADELMQVFEGFCRRHEYVLAAEASDRLHAELDRQVAERDEHFGNARLIRNLFETAIRRKAGRIIKMAPLTRELLMTITADDLLPGHPDDHCFTQRREEAE